MPCPFDALSRLPGATLRRLSSRREPFRFGSGSWKRAGRGRQPRDRSAEVLAFLLAAGPSTPARIAAATGLTRSQVWGALRNGRLFRVHSRDRGVATWAAREEGS